MLEQTANAITFYAFYVDTKVGATGLTVTVDVYRNGTAVVTAGSATEAGGGLYSYQLASGSVTTEGVYVAIFKTTDADVDQQHLASAYLIGTAGIEYLDAATSTRATPAQVATELATYDGPTDAEMLAAFAALNDLAASDVWAAATRTLTQSAASVAATVSGSNITAHRGDSLSFSLTGLGDISTRSKLWFTVKTTAGVADSASTIQIEETAGLVYLNGAAGTSGNGTLTVDDGSAGDITVTLQEADTSSLATGDYVYDVQVLTAAGAVTTLTAGLFHVTADVTRTIT